MHTMFGIAGSLREGSYNRALLAACTELMPDGWELSIYERLAEIPPYNEDVRENGNPEVVRDLKQRLRRAEALLVITPEYNYGIPGVLKVKSPRRCCVSPAQSPAPGPATSAPSARSSPSARPSSSPRPMSSASPKYTFSKLPIASTNPCGSQTRAREVSCGN
jgi:hypothetical protein